jgi:ADP-heptose:LPS heptosyltransferase
VRILFVTSNRIGDAVLSTGLLDHLLRTHPNARFTIVCGAVSEGVFQRMPRLERIITMEKRRYSRHWLPVWAACAGLRWDLVIDLRSAALAYLVPARRRVVLRRRAHWGALHKIAQLAELLGVDPAPLPVAWTGPQDEARAAALLLPREPVVCLGPTANWVPKIWPAERFVALFQALRAGPLRGARAMVMAGPGDYERGLARPVLEALPDAIDAAGHLSLPEASACIRRAALFVGNDSGLMHLAASTGAPTLGLYGPTAHAIAGFSPAGRRTGFVIARGPRMEDLPVEDALAACLKLLQPRREAA